MVKCGMFEAIALESNVDNRYTVPLLSSQTQSTFLQTRHRCALISSFSAVVYACTLDHTFCAYPCVRPYLRPYVLYVPLSACTPDHTFCTYPPVCLYLRPYILYLPLSACTPDHTFCTYPPVCLYLRPHILYLPLCLPVPQTIHSVPIPVTARTPEYTSRNRPYPRPSIP